MLSFFKSCKGIENAPLLLVFSAFVLFLTVAVVVPALSDMEDVLNQGKAVKEAERLRDAINEIAAMGDYGSITNIELNIPRGYFLDVYSGDKIVVKKQNEEGLFGNNGMSLSGDTVAELKVNTPFEPHLNSGMQNDGQIYGPVTIVIWYVGKNEKVQAKNWQIIVRG